MHEMIVLPLTRWFFPDSACSEPGQPWRLLNLHRAAGAGSFCCRSGQCVPAEARCDISVDCVDMSDEENCSLVSLPNNNYNKALLIYHVL